MKKIKKYLVDLPLKTLLQINSIVLWGYFIYILLLKDRIKNTEITYLIITLLSWGGITFFSLTLLIQFLDKEYRKTFSNKLIVFLSFIIIAVAFFGPIVSYFIAKHYDNEIEIIKQAMHHS